MQRFGQVIAKYINKVGKTTSKNFNFKVVTGFPDDNTTPAVIERMKRMFSEAEAWLKEELVADGKVASERKGPNMCAHRV